ncbi:MAG: retroviral-like aspartic protease family protein [Defluviitaleaceae bacterium]|nr:retroviral-like aspartic protease family protein [Defluviitaleaceae bacterium]
MSNQPVSLSPEGRAIVELFLKPLNKVILESIDFKLDTGADVTTIDKATLNKLGYSNNWIASNTVKSTDLTLQSAGVKRKPAYYIILPTINILGRDFTNWPLHILPTADENYPNLLGIDILQYFNFKFNYEKWEFTLIPIASPKNPKKLADNQKVYNVDMAE